jgi:putative phosphoesterase
VVVLHGHQLGRPTPETLAKAYPDASLVVFGHTHVPTIARVSGVLIVNPGCCGYQLKGSPPSIVYLTLTQERLEPELIRLDSL